MKRNINFIILFFFFIYVSFYGCASYEPKPLPEIMPEFATYSETIENVTFACEALSQEECEKYFDRNIIENGYQPLHITIANNSEHPILFSPKGVSLPVIPPDEVAEKCHTSTAGRATAYGVGALFLWPLIIPMVVDGSKSYEANLKLDEDFSEKNIDELVIDPHTKHNGVIFVATEDYQESFSVKLIDRETQQNLEYHVEGLEGHFFLDEASENQSNPATRTALSNANVDPTEPWTGIWAVEGEIDTAGTWGMKQRGKKVISTKDSTHEFEGRVRRNQLKGKITINNSATVPPYPFDVKMSADGQSFKGTLTGWDSRTHHIKGQRIK